MVSEIKQCRNSGKCKNGRINQVTGKKFTISFFKNNLNTKNIVSFRKTRTPGNEGLYNDEIAKVKIANIPKVNKWQI